MNFKYCQIDPNTASISELKEEIQRLTKVKGDFENLQMALKIFINSAYGAIGNQYFQCYNPDVAEAITLQGQDLLKNAIKHTNNYFKNIWHKDKELHSKMGITIKGQVVKDVVVYGDSITGDTLINIDNDLKIRIDLLWKEFSKLNGFNIDISGHEYILDPKISVLNYTSGNIIDKVGVSKIIRHRVTKKKWKLKTKTGKEIIVTGDHSLIVFRDGIKLEVKPNDVLKTDKVLILLEK